MATLDEASVARQSARSRAEETEVVSKAEWSPSAELSEDDVYEAGSSDVPLEIDDEEDEVTPDEEEEGRSGDITRRTRNRGTRGTRQLRLTDTDVSGDKRKRRPQSPTGPSKRPWNRRREIADIMDDGELDDSTRKAREAEAARAQRMDAIFSNLSDLAGDQPVEVEEEKRLCLNPNADGIAPEGEEGTENAAVFVHKAITSKLKPHQIVGARFLWSHIAVEPDGFGCVLADFMGLGKTLQVITVVQAFLAKKKLDEDGMLSPRHKHVLILAPTICVRNWEAEVVKWLGKKEARRIGLQTLESSREKKMTDRVHVVKQWHKRGGILIMGYELYRLLVLQSSGDEKIAASNQKYSHLIKQVYPYLSDPGPDLIVLDEGHRVRDHKSKLVKALAYVKTARRIMLTGYPLQNHLEEYWTMVNFARPDYLGSLEEFKNRFVDPINNAQCVDSSEADLRLARQRSFVLTRELKPLVLRRDQQYLFKQLPPKKEYVLLCKLTDPQAAVYRAFLENGVPTRRGKPDVLGGYHISLAISNHPDVLRETFKTLQEEARNGTLKQKPRRFTSLFGVEDDDDFDFLSDFPSSTGTASASSGGGSHGPRVIGDSSDESELDLLNALNAPVAKAKPTAALTQQHRLSFAQSFMDTYIASQLESSGKMMILMQILSECQEVGDRVIIFSQSIPTLNTIGTMISKHNKYQRSHSKRLSYLRIDGSTPQQERFRQIGMFNDLEEDVDMIMISTKAGGEGINLCAGNRIIIFDVCWNPCNDSQSMCRSYRFGQTKPVFVYRFVTAGTMEKKVYDLQIRKEGVAKRIVDEKTMERRFKSTELQNYFDMADFEESLSHAQGAKVAGETREPPEEDPVLQHILTDMQDGASTSLPGKGCIVDWFEQETMFEEDLDQQCSPAEQKEIMESYTYVKALRELRKHGEHLISRVGMLVVQCQTCRAMNEIYPASTTKVPVPSKIECRYCRAPTLTAEATAAPEHPVPAFPIHYGMGGHTPPGLSVGTIPNQLPTQLVGGAMPGGIPGGVPQPTVRGLPEHLVAVYQQQQAARAEAERARIVVAAAANAPADAAHARVATAYASPAELLKQAAEDAAKRRADRLAMKLRDRHLLVLRRGIKGCPDLKRKAEECGATLAIEVNSQLTDIVSAMSMGEALKWLKRTKLPPDVDFHDDAWLRNEIAKEEGLSTAVAAGDNSMVLPAWMGGKTSEAGAAPFLGTTSSADSSTNLSPQPIAGTNRDLIDLMDSDDDEAPTPSTDNTAGTPNTQPAVSGSSTQDMSADQEEDDDDVIEIL